MSRVKLKLAMTFEDKGKAVAIKKCEISINLNTNLAEQLSPKRPVWKAIQSCGKQNKTCRLWEDVSSKNEPHKRKSKAKSLMYFRPTERAKNNKTQRNLIPKNDIFRLSHNNSTPTASKNKQISMLS